MLPHPCSFLSFEVENHASELSTCLSSVSCLSGLRESAKLGVRAGMGLIHRDYKRVAGMNAAVFG